MQWNSIIVKIQQECIHFERYNVYILSINAWQSRYYSQVSLNTALHLTPQEFRCWMNKGQCQQASSLVGISVLNLLQFQHSLSLL